MHDYSRERSVPEGLKEAVAEGMRGVKKIHRRRMIKKAAAMSSCAVLFCAGFLIWGYHNPVLASQIPVVGGIFAGVQDDITWAGDYSDKVRRLGTAVNPDDRNAAGAHRTDGEETGGMQADSGVSGYTASDQGYTFTAGEVYCDGISLYLGMTVQKEGGFGEIAQVRTDGYEERWVQALVIDDLTVQAKDGQPVRIQMLAQLEGAQLTEDAFEGVLRIGLADAGIALPQGETQVSVRMNSFFYIDERKRAEEQENYEAHVRRDEQGNEVLDENGIPVMDEDYQGIVSRCHERGSWELCVPVVADTSDIRIFSAGDRENGRTDTVLRKNTEQSTDAVTGKTTADDASAVTGKTTADDSSAVTGKTAADNIPDVTGAEVPGIGIGDVIMTPYEIRIQCILPPLYATHEELILAKRAYAGEEGEGLTDEEIDELVSLILYGDYGVALFDENGERIEVNAVRQNGSGNLYLYPVQNRELRALHIYVGEGDIDCMKETDERAMASRALYYTEIDLTGGKKF